MTGRGMFIAPGGSRLRRLASASMSLAKRPARRGFLATGRRRRKSVARLAGFPGRWKEDEMAAGNIASRDDRRLSSDDRKSAFEAYTLAFGKISHACNYLNEQLSQMFVTVTGLDRAIALAIWYSTDNDNIQRSMLGAAARANVKFNFKGDDLKWLLDRCEELSQRCRDATNTPSSQYIGNGNNNSAVIGVSYIYGHPRAKNLMGNKLLEEFDWCERYAFALSVFAAEAESSLSSNGQYPWPNRPQAPVPRLKKDRSSVHTRKKTK